VIGPSAFAPYESLLQKLRPSSEVSFYPARNISSQFYLSQPCTLRLSFPRHMARVRHTAKAMVDEGSSSNREVPAAPLEAAEAIAASSSSSSNSESGKIFGLD
jgi:hypothetical protein